MKNKIIKINESQLKDIIFNDIYSISYANPISLKMHDKINEGYYASYPVEKVKEYITNMFHLNKEQFIVNKNENDDTYTCLVVIYVDINNLNTKISNLDKAMSLCGYFRSIINDDVLNGKKIKIIQYEPRHQSDANEFVKENKFLYHITPLYYKDKILSNGFTPKSKNILFDYPDRIYFFTTKNKKDELLGLALYYDESLNNKRNDSKYVLFELDGEKLSNTIKFYHDPNLANAVYTKENVSPQYILRHKIIDLSQFEFNKE